MKNLIDATIMGVYLLVVILGGKYSLKKMTLYVQKVALEKVATGLSDLEPITQKMTGKKLRF